MIIDKSRGGNLSEGNGKRNTSQRAKRKSKKSKLLTLGPVIGFGNFGLRLLNFAFCLERLGGIQRELSSLLS